MERRAESQAAALAEAETALAAARRGDRSLGWEMMRRQKQAGMTATDTLRLSESLMAQPGMYNNIPQVRDMWQPSVLSEVIRVDKEEKEKEKEREEEQSLEKRMDALFEKQHQKQQRHSRGSSSSSSSSNNIRSIQVAVVCLTHHTV